MEERRKKLFKLIEAVRRQKAMLLSLAIVVVFVTTYLLILPAFTLDKEEAEKQGGIDVAPVETMTDDADSDSEEDEAEKSRATDAKADKNEEDNIKDSGEEKEKASDTADVSETQTESDVKKDDNSQTKKESDTDNKVDKENGDNSLSYNGNNYRIEVTDSNNVIPAGTKLNVEEITADKNNKEYDKLYNDAIEAIAKEEGKAKAEKYNEAKLFNISLLKDNKKVELEEAVSVKIAYENGIPVEENKDVKVVHFAENKKAGTATPEVLAEKSVDLTVEHKEMTETSFEAESFSVYAVLYSSLSTDVMTADGKTYTIEVCYGEDAEIPSGAELTAEEVKEDSQEYTDYVSGAAKALGNNADSISFARFFDIEIKYKGEKIEPKAPVQVKIKYSEAPAIEEGSKLSVVHFAADGTEVIDDVMLRNDGKEIVYEQSSFSVTGTIINEPPQGQVSKCMVLVNYPNGSDNYYIVNNDGSLTKVDYSNGTVNVEDPMLWTVDGNNPDRHIYFNTEATGFNYQDTAADYFRRYLDPNSESGITEENSNNITLGRRPNDNVKSGYVVTDRSNILNQTSVNTYNDNGTEKIYHGAWNDNNSLGVELDSEGNPVRVSGKNNWNDAVNVVFAEPRSVPGIGTSHHTVDHIDISISGKSQVTVPLAFGSYYYKDASGNWQEYVVTTATSVDLEKDHVSITPEDMKRASIKAYDKNGNELDDAFVIDGYSSNASNAYSTVQVRIGGRFKVADTYDGGGNDEQTKRRRLDNKITYAVSAVKNLDFDIEDEEHGQLYEKLPDGTYRKLSINLDINMSASFDYWDSANECPGIKNEILWGSYDQWVNGGIPTHGLSGMDFVLGGDADDANSKIVALEITKMVVDEKGNLIKPSKKIVNTFDINKNPTTDNNYKNESVRDLNVGEYQRPADYNGYSKLHSKDVAVGHDGMGLVYDYAVTDGMYYITEHHDQESLPETIVDTSGKEWTYKETRIETEYVRRGDKYDDKEAYPHPLHVSDTYSDRTSDSYNSIPEVLGTFTTLKGTVKKEGFLEFFVYNVYTSVTDIRIKKTDDLGNGLEGAVFQLKVNTAGNEWKPVSEVEGYDDISELSDTTIEGKSYTSTFTTNGEIQTLRGLPDGTYKLIELDAPDGYVIELPEIEFKVENNTMSMITDSNLLGFTASSENELALLEIKNPPGAELPKAGGIGTTIFYILGTMLVLGSAVFLISRRRALR